MQILSRITVMLVLGSTGVASSDASKCPTVVTDAAKKAFPGATITACSAEGSGFEVRIEKTDKSKAELDITAAGVVEQIEENVAISSLPAAVTAAVAAKYGKPTILKAEKLTKASKAVQFEVEFKIGNKLREATFAADGTFVEEE